MKDSLSPSSSFPSPPSLLLLHTVQCTTPSSCISFNSFNSLLPSFISFLYSPSSAQTYPPPSLSVPSPEVHLQLQLAFLICSIKLASYSLSSSLLLLLLSLIIMGEESKKGEAGGEKKEEKKDKDGEEAHQEIVLKVDMHCEACAKKVARSLRRFQGVDGVKADCKASKVVVKAAKDVDPIQLQDRVHKKSGRKVEILSPLPVESPKDEPKPESKPTAVPDQPKKDQLPPPPPPPPPPVTTLILHVAMHCEACALALQKRIRKIKGVEAVETDVANDRVTVKGVIESPDQLVQQIYKRTKKHASIIKDEDKPKPAEEKGDQKPPGDAEKKQDNASKDGKEGGLEEDDKSADSQAFAKLDQWPTKSPLEYYNYAPQLFSDENPNACTVM